jgi:hypothetical protein
VNVGLWRRFLLFAVLIGLSGIVPSAGTAYHFDAVKWPGGIVRYYNAAPDQSWAVSGAVSAWNHSGAHIRFVAVPRASAQLVIEENARNVYCSEGHASVGYVHGAHVVIFPAHGVTHICNRYWAVRVMTHELGHVLGLRHEDRYCATMNAFGSMRGGSECPTVAWAWRCRLLETDDVSGVAAAYGGTPQKPTEPDVCPLYRAIDPPGAPTIGSTPDGQVVTLRFERPPSVRFPSFVLPSPWRGHDGFAFSQPMTTCAAATATVAASRRYRWNVAVGSFQTINLPRPAGHFCVAVWALDRLGRPSAPDTFTTNH